MSSNPDIPDLAIVGAGPIGIELHAAASRMGLEVIHFDARQLAHTISWYPRQVRFFSSPERIAIAGVPLNTPDQAKASREEYLAYLRGVVELFDLPIRTYEPVVELTPSAEGFTLVTRRPDGAEASYRARRVVLATGDMARPRRLGIPGEDLPHVNHYFDEPHPYFRRRLLIVGGKNSAAEAALRCHRAGARVSVSYRREHFDPAVIKYWLLPELEMLIRTGRIEFHPRTTPVEITPTHVRLAHVDDDIKATETIEAEHVLLLTGYVADCSLLDAAGVEHNPATGAPHFDLHTMETPVPGLYIAGTAAAGTQENYRLFIENCHTHVRRILTHITNRTPPKNSINPLATHHLPES